MSAIVKLAVRDFAQASAESWLYESVPDRTQHIRDVCALAGQTIRIDDIGYYDVLLSEDELRVIAEDAWRECYG